MRLTLRQLEVFCAVCRSGSVTTAAAEISLTQSAASQALAELESALDGALFDRVGRRLRRNERGDALYDRATELLARAQEIEDALRGTAGALPAHLKLAASQTIGSYLLPAAIGGFLAAHPDARVELEVRNTREVIAEVAAFRADAGFIEGPCRHAELIAQPWRQDELAVVVGARHALAHRRRIGAADLHGQTWVLREPGSGTRELFDRAAETAGIELGPVLELGHAEAIKRAVAAGAGLGCLSKSAIENELAAGTLCALKTPFLDLHRQLSIVLHRRKYLTAGLREVLAACGSQP